MIFRNNNKLNPLILLMSEGYSGSSGGFIGDQGTNTSGGASSGNSFGPSPGSALDEEWIMKELNLAKTTADKLGILADYGKLHMDPALTNSLTTNLSKADRAAFGAKLGKNSVFGKVFNSKLGLLLPGGFSINMATKLGNAIFVQTGILIGDPDQNVAGAPGAPGTIGANFIPKLSDAQYQDIADQFKVSIDDVKTVEGAWSTAVITTGKEIKDKFDTQIQSGIKNTSGYDYEQGTSKTMSMLTEGEIDYLMKQFPEVKELEMLISTGQAENVLDAVIKKGGNLPPSVIGKLLQSGDGDYVLNSDGTIGTKQAAPSGGPGSSVKLDPGGNVIPGSGMGSILGTNTGGTTTGGSGAPIDDDLWAQFVKKAAAEMEGAIATDTKFKKDAADMYGQRINEATEGENKLLGRISSDIDTQTGLFQPTQTSMGTIQPYTNSWNAKSLMSLADKKKQNLLTAADKKYGTVAERSPVKAQIDYINYLGQIAGADKAATLEEKKLAIQKYLGELDDETRKQISSDSNNVGFLDYIMGGATLYKGYDSIFGEKKEA